MLEQRRLSHMLRQRAAEIEALQDERERLVTRQRTALRHEEELGDAVRKLDERASSLAAERERLENALKAERERLEGELKAERERLEGELKQAQYEARRAERRLSETETTAAEWRKESWRELEALAAELEKAKAEHGRLRRELKKTERERDGIEAELKKTSYEARRVERRLAQVEADTAQERKEAQRLRKETRHQVDALATELREVIVARDEALGAAKASSRDHEQVVRDLTARAVQQTELALQLGKAEQEVETLLGAERSREMALAAVDATLIEVAGHLRRTRASRSWRWGHALARAFRVLTFRRGSRRSSLDAALGRLQDEGLVKVEKA